MTRFARLLLGVWICLPTVAAAQTVGVRSGDHPGFTRLVVQLPGREDWVFGRVAGGFEFRPARTEITYGLARVFDKIGRNRIADVRDLGDGRLMLAVDCACHGVVDELGNGQVVLDIANGPAPTPGVGVDAILPEFGAGTVETVEAQPESGDRQDGPALTPVALAAVSDRAGLPLTLPRAGVPTAMPVPVAPLPADQVALPDEPEPELATDGGTPEEDESSGARIEKTESALLEQIARAAAQGLLDADLSETDAEVAEATPAPAEAPPAPPVAVDPPAPPVTQRGHVTVQTSVDRAAATPASDGTQTQEGDACIDPAFFEVSGWGGDVAQGADIGAYRSRIVSELDAADGAGVTELARNYIYITFGAEAKALMRRYPDSVERPDLLYAMAEIMDEGAAQTAGDLVDQMSCDGATALWATLAQPQLRPGQAINHDAVALAFGALPPHLRQHLGPKLADRFLAADHRRTADMIRTAIDRAGRAPTSEQEMLAAQFELDAGAVDAANGILDDVVAAGDAMLPDALLRRVETTLAAGGAVPDDMVLLLDGLALQYRGTERLAGLVDAGIRARASGADFTAAFEQLAAAESAGLLTPDRSAALRAGVFDSVARDTDDTGFLRLVLPRIDAATDLPAAERRKLAARLLDLGFARPAREVLGTDVAMPDDADRQLLARAALLEANPAVAIGYLAGLNDAPALALRARALDMARDHEGALRAYEEAGEEQKVVEMAWRGGLWPEIVSRDDGALGAAARLMGGAAAAPAGDVPAGSEATTDQPATEEATPLAEAQALIAASETARTTLEALLDEISAPEASLAPETAGF